MEYRYIMTLMLLITLDSYTYVDGSAINEHRTLDLPGTCEPREFSEKCQYDEMYHCLLVNATGKNEQFKETCQRPQKLDKGCCPVYSRKNMTTMKCIQSSTCPAEDYVSFEGIEYQGCRNLSNLESQEKIPESTEKHDKQNDTIYEEKSDKDCKQGIKLIKCEYPPPSIGNLFQTWLSNILMIVLIPCAMQYLGLFDLIKHALPKRGWCVTKTKGQDTDLNDDVGWRETKTEGLDTEFSEVVDSARIPLQHAEKRIKKVLAPR